jgi:ABC-type sugar transport system ATPase subunit
MEFAGISKRFGASWALADVSLALAPGEIVGLIGHNGAGKSTLVNVATGALRPPRGELRVDGRPVSVTGAPRALQAAGVKVIHQEPALAATLSVADNIALGGPIARQSRSDRRRRAQEALASIDPTIDVDLPVAALSFGQRQLVDLARATATPVSALFLDEPTAALGAQETERLHQLVREFTDRGGTAVYVSHRLRDVLELCTRVVVLREGRLIDDRPAAECTSRQLTRALAPDIADGDDAWRPPLATRTDVGEPRLRLGWRGHDVTSDAGEVVGLFGMAGGPQFRLLEALIGLAGGIQATLDGESFVPSGPGDAIRRRVHVVAGDREREGLISDLSAIDNMMLPWMRRDGGHRGLSSRAMTAAFESAVAEFGIRGPSGDHPIAAFSGGNRQKVMLARWLHGPTPKVLALANPFQGVDVGARADIARVLVSAARAGATVLVASSESDEIALLCDRAYVCDADRAEWPVLARSPGWSEHLLHALLDQPAEAPSR